MKLKKLLPILFCFLILSSGLIVFSPGVEARSVEEVQAIHQDIKNEAYMGLATSGVNAYSVSNSWSYDAVNDTTNYLAGAYNWVIDGLSSLLGGDNDKKLNTATLYDQVRYMSQDSENILRIQTNHIDDTRNLVWSEIKYNVVKQLNNGSGEIETKMKAKRAVKDIYSRIEKNLVLQLSQQVYCLKHMEELNDNRSTLLDNLAFVKSQVKYRTYGDWWTKTKKWDIGKSDFYRRNVTLLNGSKVQVWDIHEKKIPKEAYSHGSTHFDVAVYPDESPKSGDGNLRSCRIYHHSFDEINKIEIWDVMSEKQQDTSWNQIWDKIHQEKQMMTDNVEKFVNKSYTEYRRGDINTTELIDPSVLMSQMSTKFNQTGYYGYAGSQLAMMGINSSIEHRFVIHVYKSQSVPSWEGKNKSGLLFTDHRFQNETIEKGEKYNTSRWNDTELAYFVNSKGIHRLHTVFEVIDITHYKTGKSLESVGFESYNRQSLNVSSLQSDLNQIMDLYQEVENMSVKSSGGGGEKKKSGVSLIDLFTGKYLGIPHWILFFGFSGALVLGSVYIESRYQ
ncbi:MAG: Major capsid protein of His2 family of spindle-shaped halovirus [Candidatus Methanohalarchaeum thermophilum]|uniref:Major capsid protein of His2 family of spindle-shaped halovirus n=1 Tax=Methanohalarchaeum thermophilum TaxID=1903181 RepID=A0A1Q6DVF5_METT1|nr:MAG: Major capsid protein of His2 family of spindle-shaped halovirus [Candidatus Methanohalarchaeum thermophilum]